MREVLINAIIKNCVIYIIVVIAILLITRKREDHLKEFLSTFHRHFFTMLITTVLVVVLNYLASEIVTMYTKNANQVSIMHLIKHTSRNISMVYLVFITPIFEEFVYRYLLFYYLDKYLTKYSIVIPYSITAIVFALVHLINPIMKFDFTNLWCLMLPYIVISIGTCFVYKKTNSIYSSILVHIINNLLGFLFI